MTPRNDGGDDEIIQLLKRISDNSDAMRDDLNRLDRRLELHVQKTEFELDRIKTTDDVQNQLLDEHIRGVRLLEENLSKHKYDNDLKFAELEAPSRWLTTSIKVLIAVGGVASAVYAFLKLLNIF
jgi:hypothetical protein